jgi:hypothetical protein
VTEDWLLARIEAVEVAAAAVQEALAEARAVLGPARRARVAGEPLVRIAEGLVAAGAGPRRDAAAAIHAYRHAVTAVRAEVVRALVDEEDVPLTTLSRRMGMSRQALTRLYQHGRRLHDSEEK